MLSKFVKKLSDKGEVYLGVKVRPGASESKIIGIVEDERIKIDIAVAPERGRANRELIRLIAREFKVSVENVKIISGAGSRIKLLKITLRSTN